MASLAVENLFFYYLFYFINKKSFKNDIKKSI